MAYLGGVYVDSSGILKTEKGGVIISATQTSTIPYSIGDDALGGIVIYTWSGGTHGFVCSKTDIDTNALGLVWQSGGQPAVDGVVTTGETIGTGILNTADMVTHGDCPLANYITGLTTGGYSDWYLPSKDELQLAYNQKQYLNFITGTRYYWSSTDGGPTYAGLSWRINMDNAQWWVNGKWEYLYVRPFRTF